MNINKFYKRFLLPEGWFSVFALLVAFLTVLASIENAHWTSGLEILRQAGIAAFVLGFGLAKIRFVPGLLAHAFMISVGMVIVGILSFPFIDPALADEGWTKKLGSVVLRVVKWVELSFAGNASYDPLVFLVSLTMLAWLSGFLASWLLFRSRNVWVAIAMLGTILMVNLSYNPPNPLGYFCIFLASSLLLVVRFNVFLNEERWRQLRFPYHSKVWRWAMAVGGALVLVIMMLAFAAPSASQMEQLSSVLSGVNGPWQQIEMGFQGFGAVPSAGPGREGRLPSNYNNLGKSFTIGGPISLSNDPVMRVKGDDPTYLEIAAMDQYDGKGWIATYQDPAGDSKPPRIFSQLSLAPGQSLPTSLDKGRASLHLTITPLVPNFNPVINNGDLVSVNKASLLAYHWEHYILKTPVTNILARRYPDGNGGNRTLQTDMTTGQPVPPDLLPLVKLLQDAQAQYPALRPAPAFVVNFNSNGTYTVSGNGASYGIQPWPQSAVWSQDGWLFRLPPPSELKSLNLKPGGAPDQSGKLKIEAAEVNLPNYITTLPAQNIYLAQDGTYSFRIAPNLLNSPEAARARFEATDAGQKIKAEIERLRKEVPDNSVSYDFLRGKPGIINFDGYQPNYDDLLASTIQQAPAVGESYNTTSLRFRADEQSLRLATLDYPFWVQKRYLALPEIPQRVRDLAESLTANLPNNYDKAKAIEAYLRKIPYSLNVPFIPEGRDAVDYFLFDAKIGYCTYYSSAFNVMLRSIGIPTREVTGFNGGEQDPATGSILVRGTAAHAWGQVYFPGYGWVDFEPTPSEASLNRPANPSEVQPLPTPAPQTAPAPQENPGIDPQAEDPSAKAAPHEPTPSAVYEESKPDPALARWISGLVGFGLLVTGLFMLDKWWIKRQLRLPDVTPGAVYQRMLRSAKRAGLKPGASMTSYEFAAFLAGKLPPVKGEVRSITDRYVQERFGPQVVKEEYQREMLLASDLAATEKRPENATEPTPEELWEAFKKQTVVHENSQHIRKLWQNYQLNLIRYHRRELITGLTPRSFKAVHHRIRPFRTRVKTIVKRPPAARK